MNDHLTMQKDGPQPDIDRMLGDFFQAEMPDPWPGLKVETTPRPRRVGSFWSQSSGRLALAASIALLLAGYIALSAYFPRREASPNVQDLHHIGQGHKKGPAPIIPDDE